MPEPNATNDTVLDVGEEQLARVYAKAFLGAIESSGKADSLVAEVDSLVEDVLDKFPEFEKTLASHSLSHDERETMLDNVFKGKASEPVLHLLKVLSQNDRTSSLRVVAKMIHQLHGEAQGRHEVRIHTAQPLNGELTTELKNALQAKLDIEPEFTSWVNPDLIAGMVIQVGDTVYDGSVRTTLEKTRQQMVINAVDAIESRPEKFVTEKT